MQAYIHDTAEVSPEAQIGDGTKVWNQVQIREGAIIAEISLLGMKKPNICLFFNRYRDIIEFRENYYFYA